MPASVKERVKDFMPAELVDKVATENEAKTIDELKTFLQEKKHPIVERWKAVPIEVSAEERLEVPAAPVLTGTLAAGRFKIILKNAKIHAEKVIIRRTEE